jgi:hypothetical protein
VTARRLGTGAVKCPSYAVVGECDAAHAVFHVGVLEREHDIADDGDVTVFHVLGPIDDVELPGTMKAHAAGWVDDLTEVEQSRVADWLERLRVEWENGSTKIYYTACPAWIGAAEHVNSRQMMRKFSCAGLVWCCFKESVAIEIVIGESELPDVDLETLQQVWSIIIENERAALRYFRGPGPWKVLLPGYLFHALKLARASLPYRPTTADPCFPPDPPAAAEPQAQ